jgi:hypothetical protein
MNKQVIVADINSFPVVQKAIEKAQKTILEDCGIHIILLPTLDLSLNVDANQMVLRRIILEYYAVKNWSQIVSKNRLQKLVNARHAYMYFLRKYFGFSLQQIANELALKNHTSILYAIKKINGYIEVNDEAAAEILEIENKLTGIK